MNTRKSKISFNLSPNVASGPAPDVRDAAGLAGDNKTTAKIDASSAAKVQESVPTYEGVGPEMNEPDQNAKVEFETVRDLTSDQMAQEPQTIVPEPARMPLSRSVPKKKHSRLAALGKMAQPTPSFLDRNSALLAMAAVIGVTFVLGLGTGMLMFGGDDDSASRAARFSASVTEAAIADTPTRALMPDMTEVSTAALLSDRSTDNDLSTAVLAGLQPNAAPNAEQDTGKSRLTTEALRIMSRNKIRMLREGVLADIYDIETIEKHGAKGAGCGWSMCQW